MEQALIRYARVTQQSMARGVTRVVPGFHALLGVGLSEFDGISTVTTAQIDTFKTRHSLTHVRHS